MICRIWRGWTEPGLADLYERLLREEIFVDIAARRISGCRVGTSAPRSSSRR